MGTHTQTETHRQTCNHADMLWCRRRCLPQEVPGSLSNDSYTFTFLHLSFKPWTDVFYVLHMFCCATNHYLLLLRSASDPAFCVIHVRNNWILTLRENHTQYFISILLHEQLCLKVQFTQITKTEPLFIGFTDFWVSAGYNSTDVVEVLSLLYDPILKTGTLRLLKVEVKGVA